VWGYGHEAGQQVRPVLSRRAGNDAVEVLRKSLRLDQRFSTMSASRPPSEQPKK
jgi:hypothetical protein